MFKKLNKKGFTLAELLVVVAIIGVLVAVSIPIFTSQLKKARLATNQANARAAYAASAADYLTNDKDADCIYKYTTGSGKIEVATAAAGNAITNTNISDWNLTDLEALGTATYTTWYVSIDTDGTVKQYNYQ